MKIFHFIIFLFLLVTTSAIAMMPPSYLNVYRWKSCVSTYTKRHAQMICLPDRKPMRCPLSSWRELNRYSNLPYCPDDDDGIGSGIGSQPPIGSEQSNGSERPIGAAAPQ